MKFRNIARKYGARVSAAGTGLFLSGVALAQATDPASPEAALATLTGKTGTYAPVLYGLALAATGVMIGVAWIKKARGAAR